MPRKGFREPLEDRFRKKVGPLTEGGCWPWIGGKHRQGYGHISEGGSNGKYLLAHRVAYIFAYGPIPAECKVLHRCDNPACVNPEHLFLGTQSDNVKDMVRKRRHWTQANPEKIPRGSKRTPSKLTDRDILEIRASADTQSRLARRYKVAPSLIFAIIHRKIWKHV